jgi:endonuclease-3
MKTRAVARRILGALERHHPDPDTELSYSTPFELLVATILSAQSSDRRVNEVTPALFARYPAPRSLAEAEIARLEQEIKPTGFFRQKGSGARGYGAGPRQQSTEGKCRALWMRSRDCRRRTQDGERRARSRDGGSGLPVDRHVLRVANRSRPGSIRRIPSW